MHAAHGDRGRDQARLGFMRHAKRCDQRRWVIVACGQVAKRCSNRTDVTTLAQIEPRGSAFGDWLALRPQPPRFIAPVVFVVLLLVGALLLLARNVFSLFLLAPLVPQAVQPCLAGERRNRDVEITAVEKLNQRDNIAALGASAAIPNTFLGVDAETIDTTALRTCPYTFAAATTQLDATTLELGLDRHRSRGLINRGHRSPPIKRAGGDGSRPQEHKEIPGLSPRIFRREIENRPRAQALQKIRTKREDRARECAPRDSAVSRAEREHECVLAALTQNCSARMCSHSSVRPDRCCGRIENHQQRAASCRRLRLLPRVVGVTCRLPALPKRTGMPQSPGCPLGPSGPAVPPCSPSCPPLGSSGPGSPSLDGRWLIFCGTPRDRFRICEAAIDHFREPPSD